MRNLVKKIYEFIRNTVNELRYFILKYATPSLSVVKVIRDCVNDATLDIIVSLTPTDKDNELLKTLRVILNTLFPQKDEEGKTDEEIIKAAILNIRKLSPEMRNAAFAKIASLLVKDHADKDNKTLENSDADLIAQLAFTTSKNNISL